MKRAKITLLYVMKTFGVFRVMRALTRRKVRILCYHAVWRGSEGFGGDAMFIRRETFVARLAMLRGLGFSVITLDQAVAGLSGSQELPPNSVVITIDDGWYSTFADMLPALKMQGMPATIYCDTAAVLRQMPIPNVMVHYLRRIYRGSEALPPAADAAFQRAVDSTLDPAQRVAGAREFAAHVGADVDRYVADGVFSYMTPDELLQAQAAGFAIELHTHRHTLHDFDRDKIVEEITLNRQALARILGRPAESFRHFCYPSGLTASSAVPALRSLNVVSATTLEARIADQDTDPLMLPRLLDGEQLSPVEFEAELCGVGDLLRSIKRGQLAVPSGHRPAYQPG